MSEQLDEQIREPEHDVHQTWKELAKHTRSAQVIVDSIRDAAYRLGTTACDWEYEGAIEQDVIAELAQVERSLRHVERMANIRLAVLNDD